MNYCRCSDILLPPPVRVAAKEVKREKPSLLRTLANVVDDLSLVLLVAALFLATAAKAADDKAALPPSPAGEVARQGSVVEKLPVNFTPHIGYVKVGGEQYSCVSLTVHYEDGTDFLALSRCDDHWADITHLLGEEMDKVQRNHNRIMQERKTPPK